VDPTPAFDVFVSYNRNDQAVVRRIVAKLKRRNLRVWIDEEQLTPGDPYVSLIEKGIEQSGTIAVIVGEHGMGRFHEAEQQVAVITQIDQKRRIIPVLLPGTSDTVEKELPSFLRRSTYVRFRNGLDDGDAFAQLMWGITGQRTEAAPVRNSQDQVAPRQSDGALRADTLANAADELAGAIRRAGCVTFFLGARSAPYEADAFSRPCEITRALLGDLGLITDTYDQLLPSVDTAGTYFALKRGLSVLEDRVTGLIADQSVTVPPLYEKIAEILKRLHAASMSRRRRYGSEPQLIVSTSIDLMCERALLRAGVPFTRIVQHRSGTQLTINEYSDVEVNGDEIIVRDRKDRNGARNEFSVTRDNIRALDDVIATAGYRSIDETSAPMSDHSHPLRDLALSEYAEPYLYKYHGSQDVPRSCALSTDHYLRLAARPSVPDKLIEIMGNSASVFLGCGILDADVRHTYETLLRRAFRSGEEAPPRFVVMRPPGEEARDSYRRMEATMWPRVKEAVLQQMGMTILEGQSVQFADLLLDRLR
jgi:hypothetical protein